MDSISPESFVFTPEPTWVYIHRLQEFIILIKSILGIFSMNSMFRRGTQQLLAREKRFGYGQVSKNDPLESTLRTANNVNIDRFSDLGILSNLRIKTR